MGIRNKLVEKLIRFAQNLVNKAYEKEGLTDEVLDMQVKINELRNEYDINETDEEFVQ